MGASVGAAARSAGVDVAWVSEGRGSATRARAEEAGLRDAATLAGLAASCDVVFSVCPPDAALEVARAVAASGFGGTLVDANAVAPATAHEIGRIATDAGMAFVDGGIIGPPARRPGTTRLYLSGDGADRVAALFHGSALEARVLDGPPGAASALKMCYAAWTKGSDALLIAIRALASAEGVDPALVEEWGLSQPGLEQRSAAAIDKNAFKAWRFAGEMLEIAATFRARRLPSGFHEGAADVYGRLAPYRDADPGPTLVEAVATVLGGGPAAPAEPRSTTS